MRILIPALGFSRTGGYRVLSELANAWIRDGHSVAFAAPATSTEPYFPTRASVHWLGPCGEELSAPHGQGETGIGNLRSLFGGMRRLHRDYDVVLANHSLTAWPVAFTSVPRQKRFYYVQAYEPEYYAMERRPELWLLSYLSYALPLTQIANASIYRHPRLAPVDIIPFGIDLETFFPKVPATRQAGDPLIVGCIGRSEPQKGTPYVLEAFQRLHASDPRHRLRVAYGNLPEGWTHEALEVVIPRNDAELAAFYRSVDVLVAAGTVQHGAPHYPALEALASGTALVTTGFQPATAENAWLVTNRDSAAIAGALEHISLHPEDVVRKSALGLEDARQFAWQEVAARFVKLFDRTALVSATIKR